VLRAGYATHKRTGPPAHLSAAEGEEPPSISAIPHGQPRLLLPFQFYIKPAPPPPAAAAGAATTTTPTQHEGWTTYRLQEVCEDRYGVNKEQQGWKTKT